MKHFIIASPMLLAGILFIAISLYAMYRARRENAAEKVKCDARMAEVNRQLAQREAELIARFTGQPTELLVEIDLSEVDAIVDLPVTAQRAQPLVSALSQQEQSLGGSGLILKTVNIAPGALRLTLAPVDRVGSAERVRQIAERWNASSVPLPPGVTAVRADALAV